MQYLGVGVRQIRKRLFIGLTCGALLLLALLGLGAWFLALNQGMVQRVVAATFGGALFTIFVILAVGIGSLLLTFWSTRTFPALFSLMNTAVNLLFPMALALGKIFRVDPDRIKNSYIAVNNQLLHIRHPFTNPSRLLLLAPHCLQKSTCAHKITVRVSNCHRCGMCPIDGLHTIAERYGVNLAVATGGTLARKFIEQYKPQGVVAIACERDLTSGIQDSSPLPVLGVVNVRPNGPCFNTGVDLLKVEEAVHYLLSQAQPSMAFHQAQFKKT